MLHIGDKLEVASASSPQFAKILGRGRKMRPEWDLIKDYVMLDGLRRKFSNKELGKRLLATGEEQLIEGKYMA